MTIRAITLPFILLLTAAAPAQDTTTQPSSDVERMVADGMTEALTARLGDGRTADEKHLLARAFVSRARRARQPEERESAFAEADAKYQAWFEALEQEPGPHGAVHSVRLAAARVEYAGAVPSGQIAGELSEYEIYAGQRGDRTRLQRLLTVARGQYEKAAELLAPIVAKPAEHEEELLTAGLYDTLLQTRLDTTLNLGWTHYYLGVLEKSDDARRPLLAGAERRFRELVDGGQSGAMRPQCLLALAMALRELGRYDDAEKRFGAVFAENPPPLVAAQARYELARCQMRSGKFDEARTTLRPLVEKDPDNLSPEERPARLYVNLACLWDANSYLLEAASLRAQIGSTPAVVAVRQKVQRSRETGLLKMQKLAERGGPWPELARVYLSASVDVTAPPKELSTVELLAAAGLLIDARHYQDALARLEEAAARQDADKAVAADVRFELARCRHLLGDERGAAQGFQQLAAEQRGSTRAAQAATFAYELWGKLAEQSQRSDDYLHLAATLRNLLASFADHPRRAEAAWLLPVALQLAGHYDEAAAEFAKVPADSPHAEEAQYRRALCERQALEAARSALSPADYRTRAERVATALTRFADAARGRAASASDRDQVLQWSGEARLAAAELLASAGVEQYRTALATLEGFEEQYAGSDLLGRALALRIRAYRGLREFDRAAALLAEYLKAAPSDQVGGTLGSLAQGMLNEVERLRTDGQDAAARTLATESGATFVELENWVAADPARAGSLELVRFSRARLLYLAGRYDDARAIISGLLEKSPKNGNYQHLQALILTVRLAADAPPEDLKAAREAWALLLADAALRQTAPERYWEARYNWLSLTLRLGQAAEVEKAIRQERIWRPDLGGPPWKEKLEALLRSARTAQGLPPDSSP